jgi:hypothetical protein
MASKLLSLILVVLLAIITVSLFGLLLKHSPESSSDSVAKHYLFNEEIRAFPLEETSVTFTAWKIIGSSTEQTNDSVRINYTIRNIGNKTLDLISFSMFGETPILSYGNNFYATSFYEMDNYWEFNGPTPSHLVPNQAATNGILQYEILKGSNPKQLLYPNEHSPLIIIDLT